MKLLTIDERIRVKGVVQHLELAREAARQSDHIIFHALVNNSDIKKTILEPLEEVSGWDEETDGRIIAKLSKKIDEAFSGKTIERVFEKIEDSFNNRNKGFFARLISSFKKKRLKENDYERLKKITGFLKVIYKFNYTIFNSLIERPELETLVIAPLKKMVGWGTKDTELVKELYQSMKEKTDKKRTIQEKGKKISRMLKAGAKIAIGLGIFGAVGGLGYLLLKKTIQKKTEK